MCVWSQSSTRPGKGACIARREMQNAAGEGEVEVEVDRRGRWGSLRQRGWLRWERSRRP